MRIKKHCEIFGGEIDCCELYDTKNQTAEVFGNHCLTLKPN